MLNRLSAFVVALTLLLACRPFPARALSPVPEASDAPEQTEIPLTPEPSPSPAPRGYVVVSYTAGVGFLPLPAEEEYTYLHDIMSVRRFRL